MSAISGFLGAQESASATKSAAKTASNAQVQAAQISTDALLKMWQKAQDDFAPYLSLGDMGVAQLANKIPDYMAQVVAPQYNELMGFNYSPAQQASNYSFDPVTGQRVSNAQPQYGQNMVSANSGGPTANQNVQNSPYGNLISDAQIRSAGTGANQPSPQQLQTSSGGANLISNKSFEVPGSTTRGAMINGQWVPEDQIPEQYRNQMIPNPDYEKGTISPTYGWNSDSWGLTGYEYNPPNVDKMINNPNYIEPTTQTRNIDIPSTEQLYGINMLSPQYQGQYDVPDLSANLESGGVLAPNVPDFQRDLNFVFNPNDQSYQTRMKAKEEEINNFLAKNHQLNTTAGESYRQREMDKFRASEESTQYNRALTERNYLTQTDLDKYNAEAARGNTLYGRLENQYGNLYNRQTSATQTQDANRLGLLGTRLGAGGDIYSMLYGGALDATKIGTGASASSGASSLSTGSQIGQNAITAGNAQAQNALAQGMANAQMWQGIAQQPYNAASLYQQFAPSTSYYNPSQAYAQPAWNNTYNTPLAGSGVASAPIQLGATGNTAYGM